MKTKDEKSKQIADIVDGWKNYAFRNPLTEVESLRRTAICVECPLIKNDGISRCSVCNCPTAMMTRSKNKDCEHPEGSKW